MLLQFHLLVPNIVVLLLLLGIVQCFSSSSPPSKPYGDGQSHYTKDGDLEISFEADPNETREFAKSNLVATLFFEAEKENRQVFNMDVCIDFFDRNNQTFGNQTFGGRKASVILCYDGKPDTEIVPIKDLEGDSQGALDTIGRHCGSKKGNNSRRGIRLDFEPDTEDGQYTFYSQVDQFVYRLNITDFDKDEVKVFRLNEMAKYCFRLEMGRLPPEQEELAEQQQLVQRLLDGVLLDAAANNRSDNWTSLFGAVPEITLQVDDLMEVFSLRTLDLSNVGQESQVLNQDKRSARTFYGLFPNKTREALKENKTLEEVTSKKLYKDFVNKMKTDKNYKLLSKNVIRMEVLYSGMHFLNFSFNGGNVFPCRTEWVDLDKFQMERDFYHEAIFDEFWPVHFAYTVGLVGWKSEEDRGFGPGYKKIGKFGPGPEDIQDLKLVLEKTKGFMDLDERLQKKFLDWQEKLDDIFKTLDEYHVPLQLNQQHPLGQITVKQLVFVCSEYTFNMPHVASFSRGVGL